MHVLVLVLVLHLTLSIHSAHTRLLSIGCTVRDDSCAVQSGSVQLLALQQLEAHSTEPVPAAIEGAADGERGVPLSEELPGDTGMATTEPAQTSGSSSSSGSSSGYSAQRRSDAPTATVCTRYVCSCFTITSHAIATFMLLVCKPVLLLELVYWLIV
jgi:hypothetical protein